MLKYLCLLFAVGCYPWVDGDLHAINNPEDCPDPTEWYVDGDGDGYGDPLGKVKVACDPPGELVDVAGDCDDTDPATFPDAAELCDGLNSSCSEVVAEDERDDDGDGFVECEDWTGDAGLSGGDCDPTDGSVFPNAVELCDGLVNACGGDLPADEIDGDGDGYVICDIDINGWDGDGSVTGGLDCDDGDSEEHPDVRWYADADGDGYGDVQAFRDCQRGAATDVLDNSDCSDIDPNVWNACLTCGDADGDLFYSECDDYVWFDEDCDDTDLDNWTGCATCLDSDGDNYFDGCDAYTIRTQDCDDSDADNWVGCASCIDTDGDGAWVGCDAFVVRSEDCDDADATVFPAAPELCDGRVNDCGGVLPQTESDVDGDLWVACTVDGGGWDGAPNILGGADCDDADGDNWVSCASCVDLDVDGAFVGCDAFLTRPEDCDDGDDTRYPNATEICDGLVNDCGGLLPADESDIDADLYVDCTFDIGGWDGDPAVLGDGDCDDGDADNWTSCLTCLDGDLDGSRVGCDRYTLEVEDCDDSDPDNWISCGTCVDADGDGAHVGCDAYVNRIEDCDDAFDPLLPGDGLCRTMTCYMPFAVDVCGVDITDPAAMEVTRVLDFAGAGDDDLAWALRGITPTAGTVNARLADICAGAPLTVGEWVNVSNGQMSSPLNTLETMIIDGDPWDVVNWGALPPQGLSSLPPADYGNVVEGPVPVVDACGSWSGSLEVLGFAWGAIYDINTGAGNLIKMRTEITTQYTAGGINPDPLLPPANIR